MTTSGSRDSLLSRKTLLPDVALGFVGVLVSIFAVSGVVSAILVSWVIVAEVLYCLIRVRRNRLLLVVYCVIAYSCYSICYANYLNRIDGTMFTASSGLVEAKFALGLLLLFVSCLTAFLPKEIESYAYGTDDPVAGRFNPLIVTAICAALLFIFVYAFGRPDQLGDERGAPSALYEYSVILFIAAFYFAGNSKGLRGLLAVILVLFGIQNLAYGGRITAVQLFVVMFFFLFNKKTKTRFFVGASLVFVAAMVTYGAVRTSLWSEGFSGLIDSFVSNMDTGFAWDTAYSSWYTSITFIQFDGITSQSQHLYYLGQWLMSIPFGDSLVRDGNLAALTKPFFFHWDGGILPIYVWFHLGFAGVAGSAAFVSLLSSAANRFDSATLSERRSSLSVACGLCIIYFVATSPRWFLYSPSQITRGMLLCLIVCTLLVYLDRNMNSRRNVAPQDRQDMPKR